MSDKLEVKTPMTDVQLLKRVLEEKMKWTKIQTKKDPKKPLPNARLYGGETVKDPDLLIRVEDLPGGRYADVSAKFNDQGTLTIYSDPHGMQDVQGYEQYRGGSTQEEWKAGMKKFLKDIEVEYIAKDQDEINTQIGAYTTKDWTLEGTEYRMEGSIDEDNVDRLKLLS